MWESMKGGQYVGGTEKKGRGKKYTCVHIAVCACVVGQ